MERKIGEIFKFGGEWYQCVKQPEKYDNTVCELCDFSWLGNCELDRCSGTYRSDKKSVIFKKLEKVGEPYEFDGHIFQAYRTFEVPIFTENYATVRELGNNSKISIEIKQNKEDMEEKKIQHYDCFFDRKPSKSNLKPFSLEAAKLGKPVRTSDGRRARIICADAKSEYPVIALVERGDGTEAVISYRLDGRRGDNCLEASDDLMMLPEKKEGWINVYKGGKLDADYIYPTKADAVENIFQPMKDNYIDTIKVEWEE